MDKSANVPWVFVGLVSLWFFYALSLVFAYGFWRRLAHKDWAIALSTWWVRIFGLVFAAIGLMLEAVLFARAERGLEMLFPLLFVAMGFYFAFRPQAIVAYNLAVIDSEFGMVITRFVGLIHTAFAGYFLYDWLHAYIESVVSFLRARLGL